MPIGKHEAILRVRSLNQRDILRQGDTTQPMYEPIVGNNGIVSLTGLSVRVNLIRLGKYFAPEDDDLPESQG